MYHFINCILLAFAPHVLIYKSTKLFVATHTNQSNWLEGRSCIFDGLIGFADEMTMLTTAAIWILSVGSLMCALMCLIPFSSLCSAEESGFRACVFAAIGYALTQLFKVFVMATCLPSASVDETVNATKEFGLIEEVLKSIISLLEVVGVQYIFQYTPNLAKFSAGTRILAIAVGMAFADSLLKYFLPLFWGARGMEFSWAYLEMSLHSNVNLLLTLAFVTLVWLRTRTDFSTATLPLVWASLAGICALPSVDSYLSHSLKVDSWSILAFHTVVAFAAAILAKILFNAYMSARAKKQ